MDDDASGESRYATAPPVGLLMWRDRQSRIWQAVVTSTVGIEHTILGARSIRLKSELLPNYPVNSAPSRAKRAESVR